MFWGNGSQITQIEVRYPYSDIFFFFKVEVSKHPKFLIKLEKVSTSSLICANFLVMDEGAHS